MVKGAKKLKLKELLKKSEWLKNFVTATREVYFKALTVISPKLNTKARYKYLFGEKLDLDNPVTLNQKILWLKLNRYMKDPLVIQCADKVAVREYIKDCGCEEILIDAVAVYNSADEIDWEALPDKFAMKWNFGAGKNIICTDKTKMNKDEVIRKMQKWGREKAWLSHSELQYKYIPRKIICEKLINGEIHTSEKWKAPEDYKVFCFNGEPEYVMVCVGRENGHPKFYFFDKEWNFTRLSTDGKAAPENFTLEKPKCLDKLLEYSRKLTKAFPFVRADFYIENDKVYFGELTFTPSGGMDNKRARDVDEYFGSLLNL